MSMPNISEVFQDNPITRDEALNIMMASIAAEELSLAHILNAEGEKLQYILGTLEGRDPGEVTICDILEANKSVQQTLRDVTKAEIILQYKLENAMEIAQRGDEG